MTLCLPPESSLSAPLMRQRLRQFASGEKAIILQRFFKTGPGQYGEGDRFLGIVTPDIRLVAKECRDAPLAAIRKLLRSMWHEERLLALLILVGRFERGDARIQKKICDLYLRSARFINNWDLVDLTAPKIVGPFLADKPRAPLYRLAASENLWERRIAILATFHFIRRGDFTDTLAISGLLLRDREDLLHKAVGWMLRETGKRDSAVLEGFLRKHYAALPRTTLRYAIERFPEPKRKQYLEGTAL
ncbi:MAG: DNA alkylation repair protein [Smithellaceae bacterium]|nr:DNA alkylation repair protein [Smithellaceae bacterium]